MKILVFILPIQLMAFQYFSSEKIEYWKQPRDTSFKWQKYLDPKNKEFFREGDYTPPAPFMELVRSPSDKNIKNWFLLMEKKNLLAQKLRERIADYVRKNPKAKVLKDVAGRLPKMASDYSRFRFRLYFESTCPHCKRMMQTMIDLQKMGYFVEIRQIDKRKVALPFPITHVNQKELQDKQIKSWPVLLIGDLVAKKVYRLDGYRHTSEVILAMKNKGRKP